MSTFEKSGYKSREKWRAAHNRQQARYYAKTAKYPRKEWGSEEDAAVLAHAVPDRVLSEILGRSMHSIQNRRCRLNKGRRDDGQDGR